MTETGAGVAGDVVLGFGKGAEREVTFWRRTSRAHCRRRLTERCWWQTLNQTLPFLLVRTAALLAAGMVLDDVALVDCTARCGHWLYSDRGPVECPCHWPVEKAARVARALVPLPEEKV